MHLAGGVLRLQTVFRGRHVPDLPRAVHLIAQAPVLNFVGLFNAVAAAQVTPLGSLLDVAVFDQRCRSLRRTRAQVQPHQRTRAHKSCSTP